MKHKILTFFLSLILIFSSSAKVFASGGAKKNAEISTLNSAGLMSIGEYSTEPMSVGEYRGVGSTDTVYINEEKYSCGTAYAYLNEAQRAAYMAYIKACYVYYDFDEDEIELNCHMVHIDKSARVKDGDVALAIQAVHSDHPEIFWYSNGYVLAHSANDNYISALAMRKPPIEDYEELNAMIDELKIAADDILGGIDIENMKDAEIALAIHDALCERIHYVSSANGNYGVHRLYSALVDGAAVCDGYSKAYSYLLGLCGITSTVVVNSDDSHAWNLVYLDDGIAGTDDWYETDLTWDDKSGSISHEYYNLTSEEMREKHGYSSSERKTGDVSSLMPMAEGKTYTYIHTLTLEDYQNRISVRTEQTKVEPSKTEPVKNDDLGELVEVESREEHAAMSEDSDVPISLSVCGYSDVKSSDFFAEQVKYVTENKIMLGTGGGNFSPYTELTRGMLVQMLYRLESEPSSKQASAVFDDVDVDGCYASAIAWAAENSIVNGYGNGSFGSDDHVTMEQALTILHRYAVYRGDADDGDDETAKRGSDVADGNVSAWAAKSVGWASDAGLTDGVEQDGKIAAAAKLLRYEVAMLIDNFCGLFSEK